MLKRGANTNDKDIYARYKKVRSAKAQCFNEKLAEVKSVAAYWNLIAEATNPVRRNRIGPGGWKPCHQCYRKGKLNK